jgi:hypothetical protein
MSAGLRDRETRDRQPRPLEEPALHCLLQAEVRPGRIAHRCEPPVQHLAHDPTALRHQQRRRLQAQVDQVVRSRHHVHMRVDQPRQHDAARRVDQAGIIDRRCARHHRRDSVALQHDA